jgi:V-type H+-transporting ATPase subunit E
LHELSEWILLPHSSSHFSYSIVNKTSNLSINRSIFKMADTNRQIKQMVNFIMQEAHEKVNEIRIKTEHDFNLEKQMLVHNGKIKIQEEFAQKEKDLEIQQRVQRSSAIGNARVKKMKARDELLDSLRKECATKLSTIATTPQYPELLKKLIIQGLIKIEEPVVAIQCRPEDKSKVEGILKNAVAEYKQIMTAAGHKVKPQVTMSNTPLSSKNCSGGVVLSADNFRIVLNQTLDERLQIAYHDVMPAVRKGLFKDSA